MSNFFGGIKFVITGEIKEEVKLLLLHNGAEGHMYFTDQVTHCTVGDDPCSDDICDATEIFEIPAVTQEWVSYSFKCCKLLPTSGFTGGSKRLFTGVVATFSKIPLEDSKKIWAMLKFYGGTYSSIFNKATTHVIVTKPEGHKYEKALHYPGLVALVTPDWLVDSIRADSVQLENAYHPRLLLDRPHLAPGLKQKKDCNQIQLLPELKPEVPVQQKINNANQPMKILDEVRSQEVSDAVKLTSHPENPNSNDNLKKKRNPYHLAISKQEMSVNADKKIKLFSKIHKKTKAMKKNRFLYKVPQKFLLEQKYLEKMLKIPHKQDYDDMRSLPKKLQKADHTKAKILQHRKNQLSVRKEAQFTEAHPQNTPEKTSSAPQNRLHSCCKNSYPRLDVHRNRIIQNLKSAHPHQTQPQYMSDKSNKHHYNIKVSSNKMLWSGWDLTSSTPRKSGEVSTLPPREYLGQTTSPWKNWDVFKGLYTIEE